MLRVLKKHAEISDSAMLQILSHSHTARSLSMSHVDGLKLKLIECVLLFSLLLLYQYFIFFICNERQ